MPRLPAAVRILSLSGFQYEHARRSSVRSKEQIQDKTATELRIDPIVSVHATVNQAEQGQLMFSHTQHQISLM